MQWNAISIYIKGDLAYIPTTVEMGGGPYVDGEPVEIADSRNDAEFAEALKRAFERGHAIQTEIGIVRPDESPLVRASGSKTWRWFAKGTELFVLRRDTEGVVVVVQGKSNAKGAWVGESEEVIMLGHDLSAAGLAKSVVAVLKQHRSV